MSGPNEHQQLVLSLASFNRGAILTSYAQVEFLLVDLVLRWRRQTSEGSENLPYTLDQRIRAARNVIDADERFAPYRAEVAELIEGLKPFREIRDMMAHAMVMLRTHKDEWHELEYRMFRKIKGTPIEVAQLTTSAAQLANAALEIGKYAQRFVTLWRRIYLEQGMQPVA